MHPARYTSLVLSQAEAPEREHPLAVLARHAAAQPGDAPPNHPWPLEQQAQQRARRDAERALQRAALQPAAEREIRRLPRPPAPPLPPRIARALARGDYDPEEDLAWLRANAPNVDEEPQAAVDGDEIRRLRPRVGAAEGRQP